jgi:hypothetical protein
MDNYEYHFVDEEPGSGLLKQSHQIAELKRATEIAVQARQKADQALGDARQKARVTERALLVAEAKVANLGFILEEISRLRVSAGEECVVCLEPFETCTTFQCGHSFCEPCAAQFEKCPLCRSKAAGA